jgi:RNA polymerase sigma-70 factor (ECF subfamily)
MSTVSLVESIQSLVKRAIAGDQAAMVQIVDRYRQRVFSLCYRMLRHREDAEDVSQEAFFRVLRNLSRWDEQRDFEPWLLTIAANRCRTQLAKRGAQSSTLLPSAPVDDRWRQTAHADQLREEVYLAVTELPPSHGRAFTLFHQQQLSYGEISTALGVPEGTVKTWVHRARRELVRRLVARKVIED